MRLTEPPFQPAAPGESLREFYLRRLQRLVRLRTEYDQQLNDLGAQLLDRAIYTTFRDCVATGAADRARQLTGGVAPRQPGGQP